jgi:hypothetical protein
MAHLILAHGLAGSVARLLINDIRERLTAAEALKILDEKIHGQVDPTHGVIG